MQYKVTHILLTITFIGVIVAIFGLGVADISMKSSVDYDNSTLEKYNHLDEMYEMSGKINQSENSMKTSGGLLDILGEWFQEGYRAFRYTKSSIDTLDEMQNDAIDDMNLGTIGSILKTALGIAVVIIILIGIIIAAVMKRDT